MTIPIILLLTLTVACSSDTHRASPVSTKTRPTPAQLRAATTLANELGRTALAIVRGTFTGSPDLTKPLLRRDEVPAGYTKTRDVAAPDAKVLCDAAGSMPTPTRATEVAYQRGVLGPFITNRVETYTDIDATLRALADGVRACETYTEPRDDGITVRGTFRQIQAPPLGDRSFAAEFSSESHGVPVSGTLVVVARGNLSSTVTVLDLGAEHAPTMSTIEHYVNAVAHRLGT